MKKYGIVDSGDALTLGVGAMTDARMKSFFDEMVRAGVVKPGVDYRKAYTLQFVDKKVGLDLRPKTITNATGEQHRVPIRWSRCAASARRFPTARWRSRASISTCARANSCRSSARRDAANRRRCGSSPA